MYCFKDDLRLSEFAVEVTSFVVIKSVIVFFLDVLSRMHNLFAKLFVCNYFFIAFIISEGEAYVTITDPLLSGWGHIGQPYSLLCRFQGCSCPEITWYKDGVQLSDGIWYKMSYVDCCATLNITSFTSSDAGIFECEIRAGASSASCSCCITLEGNILSRELSCVDKITYFRSMLNVLFLTTFRLRTFSYYRGMKARSPEETHPQLPYQLRLFTEQRMHRWGFQPLLLERTLQQLNSDLAKLPIWPLISPVGLSKFI